MYSSYVLAYGSPNVWSLLEKELCDMMEIKKLVTL